jgi:hypothetical protein
MSRSFQLPFSWTDDAHENRSEMFGATGLGDHPWPLLPRRIVTHVLRVATLQVGDPIADVVLVKPDDAAWNSI